MFLSVLNHANITSIFKKGYRRSKENNRPASIPPVISKVFEKLLCNQIKPFMNEFLSKYKGGFRKRFNALHCFLAMLEKWKKAVDTKNVFGALLTDLSKAFNCLRHDLVVAKLNPNGFSLLALNLFQNYLAKRKQRTKIIYSYSTWSDILFGVPQRSILGSLLFNTFLRDLFRIVKDVNIASYADDNALYDSIIITIMWVTKCFIIISIACNIIITHILWLILSIQNSSKKLFQWFSDNPMKGNAGKCHLLMSTNESVDFQLGGSLLEKKWLWENVTG